MARKDGDDTRDRPSRGTWDDQVQKEARDFKELALSNTLGAGHFRASPMNLGQDLTNWLHDVTNWLNGPAANRLGGPFDNFLSTGWGILAVVAGAILVIGLPCFIAQARHTPWQAQVAVGALIIFLGATGIGWFIALIVALRAPNTKKLAREQQRDRERAAMHDDVVRYKIYEPEYRNN